MNLLIVFILCLIGSLACDSENAQDNQLLISKNIYNSTGENGGNWNFESADTLFLEKWLQSKKGILHQVYQASDKHRLQILFTRISVNNNGDTLIRHYTFRNNPKAYHNPASTVKLPTALFALEKLTDLSSKGFYSETPFRKSGLPQYCIAPQTYLIPGAKESLDMKNTVALALSVSDDQAYNTLFDFVGRNHLNKRLDACGFTQSRILQKFQQSCSLDDARFSPGFDFYNASGKWLELFPTSHDTSHLPWPEMNDFKVGKAHLNNQNQLIPQARNFYGGNLLPLEELHRMLAKLFMPNLFPPGQEYLLNSETDSILKWALWVKPAHSGIQKLRNTPYHDAYTSYFFSGNNPEISLPENLKIYNVVGQSYGFLTESAYCLNTRTSEAWILSATLYVNENEIINDGKYEYQKIGFPFLKSLSWDMLSIP